GKAGIWILGGDGARRCHGDVRPAHPCRRHLAHHPWRLLVLCAGWARPAGFSLVPVPPFHALWLRDFPQKNLVLGIAGAKSKSEGLPSYTFVDNGEGQDSDHFETTFLSLSAVAADQLDRAARTEGNNLF